MRHFQRNLLVGILLVGLSLLTGFLLANFHTAAASSMTCNRPGKLYQVVIENNRVSPENTDAQLCDKLMFINRDNVIREIAFGPHEHHVAYDGVESKTLRHNQSFVLTLDSTGLYHFHDHFHDEASGFFSVSK